MRRHLRINFLLPGYSDFPIGGYRVVYEYADALAARGHNVGVLFPEYITSPRELNTRFHRVKRGLWRARMRIIRRPLVSWHRFDRRVRLALVPDLSDHGVPDADVVVATAWNTAVAAARLSQRKGAKYYLVQHYELMHGAKEEVDATWRHPMRKIVISRWLEQIGRELGASNMRYIPNGIDFDHFRLLTPPRKRPMHIATLNHSQPFKGVSDALAALEMYHERYPRVPVTMFGVPHRGYDIPDWVRYVHNPDQDSLVRDVYNQATVYLGASLSEGFGLPAAEAMACGCAFVGTDIGGFREFATHEKTALLCPPGDRELMCENLVRLTQDVALRFRIQHEGTEHIRQFTWERAANALESYFLESCRDDLPEADGVKLLDPSISSEKYRKVEREARQSSQQGLRPRQ